MKQVHWQHSNHFVHYGGAGLNMLAPHTMGFLQEFDGGFRFDDLARSRSDKELVEQLAVRIFDQSATVVFCYFRADLQWIACHCFNVSVRTCHTGRKRRRHDQINRWKTSLAKSLHSGFGPG
jgi:hypothetical protein